MAGKAQVRCSTDGAQVVPLASIILDDAEEVYRFTCPSCGEVVERMFDAKIRSLLRSAGVATLDETVASAAVVLQDDDAIERWLLEDA